ncbi:MULTISPECIES: gamma carbonic anhydrase family protein [Subtercola]|uniref:Gamma carbonic anhydrase family protein n=1 Tax=Subtercola vilae TaxID=2056433 RepID=A0A4T2BYA1_9MICO|nr:MULTISPECIES: gamma carbonic anhydrase family protein [Subtercola]MEA9985567.1 gamma carbonic anhydrase family protein [Subtercola sp. RTI3]TIH36319.1 gamma carbonic anhydrase family protein [Subtercola vilae]
MTSVALIIPFGGRTPLVAETAWLAPTATVIGDVSVGAEASVFYGAVVRADSSAITLGARSNLQDTVVVHGDPGFPARIGSGVSVGHGAVLHGCTIEDDCLIGMNATVLNGAVIGAESLVAAGALILEGTVIPAGSLVAGVPGKVRRELTAPERAAVRENAATYVRLSAEHRVAAGG